MSTVCKQWYHAWLLAGMMVLSASGWSQTVVVNAVAPPPVNANIGLYFASPSFIPTLTLTGGPNTGSRFVVVRGSLERIAPTQLTINVGPLVDSFPIFLSPNKTVQLVGPSEKLSTFNYFRFNQLNISGAPEPQALMIDPNQPGAQSNIRLPDGTYRLCFTVIDASDGTNITDPSSVCPMFTIQCQPNNAATSIAIIPAPPLNPSIVQSIGSNAVASTVQFTSPTPACLVSRTKAAIIGRIERLSPSPFTITTNAAYRPSQTFNWGGSLTLNGAQQLDAFGNFLENNLQTSGIDLASLRDPANPGNLRLPDGNYRICYTVRYVNSTGSLGGDASNPNLGCASFTICTKPGSAPQFIQPVNTVSVASSMPTITPTSPIVFTWTPPQSICGSPRSGYSYDLEIRELLPGQTVTDVVNNPFVFQKTALPSTTFVLDTNLFRSVLQLGKRYGIRVRAYSASPLDTFAIDNNGFSRVEAFQYGNNQELTVRSTTQVPLQDPDYFYIPFGRRRTDNWDDVYTAFKEGKRRDTLIPVQEYIALNLIQNGIAYNPDAIELFLALNPQLAGLKQLRLSTAAVLPNFPEIPQQTQAAFNEEHRTNLTPDPKESTRFQRYLDSLAMGNYPGNGATAITSELKAFGQKAQATNRVTMSLLNSLFAELLYNLRQLGENKIKPDDSHLQTVAANMRELMANVSNTTSFIWPDKQSSTGVKNLQLSLAGYAMVSLKNKKHGLPVEETLLPLSVVVWKGATAPPARPVYQAPDLTKAYKIYYTLPSLYNNKNPAINANSLPGLASTSQVSLPKLGQFKFWTLNMVNHKLTNAVDVETNDVFLLNNKKKWGDNKKLYVVLKVE